MPKAKKFVYIWTVFLGIFNLEHLAYNLPSDNPDVFAGAFFSAGLFLCLIAPRLAPAPIREFLSRESRLFTAAKCSGIAILVAVIGVALGLNGKAQPLAIVIANPAVTVLAVIGHMTLMRRLAK